MHGYDAARRLMRSGKLKQAGFFAEHVTNSLNTFKQPMLFLEGAEHIQLRKQTARFFTPATTNKNYREMMMRYSRQILDQFQAQGSADLSDLSMELAVRVAAQVVGLTNSDISGMSKRLAVFFEWTSDIEFKLTPKHLWQMACVQFHQYNFMLRDVMPAVRARRREPQADLLSHLLEKEYSNLEILMECLMFAAAGMVTTREFIVVAAWHMLEHPDIREQYESGNEAERYLLLHELLRLEPVITRLYRRSAEPVEYTDGHNIPAGELVAFDIYTINADELTVGAHPDQVCPARDLPRGTQPYMMSFGDGNHRCPGAYIAIQETDIFLQQLLKIEGLHMKQKPTVSWNEIAKGYELRDCIIGI